MADYRYMRREYIPQERFRPDARGWETTYAGVGKNADGWCRMDFPEEYQDLGGRAVIVNGYVTTTETIVEQVGVPMVNRYGNSSPTKVGQTKDHGEVNNGLRRSVSPSQDQPPKVEHTRKVQPEESRQSKAALVSSFYWHQKPSSYGHGGTNDYGMKNDTGTNGRYKPSGNTMRQPNVDSPFGGNDVVPERKQEPTVIASGERSKPSQAPNDSPLKKPTNDSVVDYVKEATKPPSVTKAPAQQGRVRVPTPMVSTADFPSVIDSREAAWRYRGQVLWE